MTALYKTGQAVPLPGINVWAVILFGV